MPVGSSVERDPGPAAVGWAVASRHSLRVTHSPASRPDDRTLHVLVIDADRRVRHSLSGLIELADGLVVAGSAADASTAMAILERDHVDVCLIDPRLPELDAGMALMARLHDRWPDVALVAMGWSDAIEHPALASGAVSFVSKCGQPDLIVDALQAAAHQGPTGTLDAGSGH